MLAVLFNLGANRYAVDSRDVVEVIPLVALTAVPQAPAAIAGQFDYRGTIVPVVDLRALVEGHACASELSTRILITRYRERLLGVMAEKVTEVRRLDGGRAVAAPVSSGDAPYLAGMMVEERGLVQFVQVDELLTPSVQKLLFA